MPGRGRPPKPVEDHKRTGTFRPHRHGERGGLAAVPSTPPDLVELPAADVMGRILQDGVVWLASTDTVALALVREALEERADVRERALGGSSEARRELRELDKQIISQLSALGFDPAARSRLGLAEVKARSKLEDLRQRQSPPESDAP